MNTSLSLSRKLINFGIPLTLFGVLIILMKSPIFAESKVLSLAITLDLLLFVPLIYFLLIRKSEIPKTTVVPVLLIGLLIGSYFLPEENQSYLTLFKSWVLPVIEISVLTFVIIKVRSAVKKYKALKNSTPDFFSTLRNTCYKILPKKLALPFATEVAVIYYAFINWKTRTINEDEFTYHKRTGTPALFGAFIFIIDIETVALHFLLVHWSTIAAWILSALSIYTAIQVLGFAKSLSRRPISIKSDSLYLKYGILSETEIPFANIDFVELSRKTLPKNKLTRKLSPLGELESHNVVIHLKNEHELTMLYGIRKKFTTIGLHVDQPDVFVEKIKASLKK